MATVQDTWNQYALVAELASRTEGRTFGRTALQKLTYLLQELHDVPAGYDFPLYTYGPYSSELSSDLQTLAAMQGVQVAADARQGGYAISPGARASAIRAFGKDFLAAHEHAITSVVGEFGGMSAKELELRTTVVFAERDARRRGSPLGEQALIDVVHEIKPHFSKAQIRAAIRDLDDRGHIEVA